LVISPGQSWPTMSPFVVLKKLHQAFLFNPIVDPIAD
jgi:hypothetical protein